VKQMLFQVLDGIEVYDGIRACVWILHLPYAELEYVFQTICISLKSNDVFCKFFKYGNFEKMHGETISRI